MFFIKYNESSLAALNLRNILAVNNISEKNEKLINPLTINCHYSDNFKSQGKIF